jgi:hypothetical protein
MAADTVAPFLCPTGALKVGDRVRTPSRRWETVTALDGTGPDFPWVWKNRHPVITYRPTPAAPGEATAVPARSCAGRSAA